MDNVDFKILQTSFNAVKEELENINSCLKLYYDDFNKEQQEQVKEMYKLMQSVLKGINFTLYPYSSYIAFKNSQE